MKVQLVKLKDDEVLILMLFPTVVLSFAYGQITDISISWFIWNIGINVA